MLQQLQQAPVRGLASAVSQQAQQSFESFSGLEAPSQQIAQQGFGSLSQEQQLDFIKQTLIPAMGFSSPLQAKGASQGLDAIGRAQKYKSASIVAKENNLGDYYINSRDQLKGQQFIETKVSIKDLIENDPDLKTYIELGFSKDKKHLGNIPTTAKPIVGKYFGKDNRVIDGIGRIQKAWSEGKEFIYVNLSIKPKVVGGIK